MNAAHQFDGWGMCIHCGRGNTEVSAGRAPKHCGVAGERRTYWAREMQDSDGVWCVAEQYPDQASCVSHCARLNRLDGKENYRPVEVTEIRKVINNAGGGQ